MIKLTDLLNEVKIQSPIHIILASPNSGVIYVNNKPINIEIYGKDIFLDEYDEDVYNRYNIVLDYNNEDEEYYPVDESEQLVQILLPKLKGLDAKIEDNGYGVSVISIPLDKAKRLITYNYPKYLGNGEFTYKGKTITYKQPTPDKPIYDVYGPDGKLIRTINTHNSMTNFEQYMRSLEYYGTSRQYVLDTPYNIMKSLP
jgi:hypothetical protein